MKYLLMVGHGQFPPGLHNALTMFASDTPDPYVLQSGKWYGHR